MLQSSSRALKLLISHSKRGSKFVITPTARMSSLADSPMFQAIFTDEVKTLQGIFQKHGYDLRLAGGAVRDILAKKTPKDLDFATPATPEEMKTMFTSEGVRMIHALGESHGTITARINDVENFEVTTLRIDRVTDGRHAEVEFTTDWKLDANRRDLTINSMFLGLDGTLYDYFGGREDLARGRVAFVGDARKRIQEDYLRILRYFRFFGRVASDGTEHEDDTIEAIRENAEGLARISGERIWVELKKILSGNLRGELTLKMVDVGLSKFIGLPEEPWVEEFQKVYTRSLESGLDMHYVTLLAGLLRSEEEMTALHKRLKTSAFERDLGFFVIAHRGNQDQTRALKFYQDLVADNYKQKDAQAWSVEVLKYRGEADLVPKLESWKLPPLPVNGHDLIQAGCDKGRMMTVVFQKMREVWKREDFKSTKEGLLEALPGIVDNLKLEEVTRSPKEKRKKKN